MARPRSSLLGALLVALVFTACAVESSNGPESAQTPASAPAFDEPGFAELEAEIRARYPDVRQLSTQALAERLDRAGGPPLLLDVRAEREFAVSHLPSARRAESAGEALDLLRDVPRDREIVVYCSVGYRSSGLAEELADAGFTNVTNLEGSIFAWANEGRELESADGATTSVHPYDASWGRFLERSRWSFGDE